MQLLRPPLSQCYSSYHLPTLATLTHVLIYIFVNIYLHICMIVHICYGIYLHFCVCANICKFCRVAERLEEVALHIWAATDVKLCEMIAHEDKCQFRIPSAYFGTFSQNIFWKHCSFISVSNCGVRRPLLFLPLLGQSPEFDICLQNGRIAWVALAMWSQDLKEIYPYDPHKSVEMLMWNISVNIGGYE